jgi:hypothetical protein
MSEGPAVAWRLDSEDDLLWATYRRDVGERLGLANPAAALDRVMADWGWGVGRQGRKVEGGRWKVGDGSRLLHWAWGR